MGIVGAQSPVVRVSVPEREVGSDKAVKGWKC